MAEPGGNPYWECKQETVIFRIFPESVDEEKLVWHRDRSDRYVFVINSGGWKIQFDNSIPQDLITGDSIIIPKEKYHRVIKGTGSLSIMIIEKY